MTTASIVGQVTDRTGAAVMRAEVVATEQATNQRKTVETDERGRFRLPYLAVGRYAVTVRAARFGDAARTVYNTQGYTQFCTPTVLQGNPNVGLYAQDEWRVGRGVTLNVGVRYDLQFLKTIATDKRNVSPRVGVAWAPRSGTPVRVGFGLFYDRVPLRVLANALLSAGNTTDVGQAALLSDTFTPGQAGAPVFRRWRRDLRQGRW